MEGEATSRFIETRLDGPGLTADDVGDVVFTEIGVVAKHDDDAQVRREVVQRRHHVVGNGYLGDAVLDHRNVVQITVGPTSMVMGNLLTELGVAGIDNHAIKPGLETRAGHQRITKLPRPQKRLLNRVLGVKPITQDEVRGPNGTRVAVLEPSSEFVDVDGVTHLDNLRVTSSHRFFLHIYRDSETMEKVRDVSNFLRSTPLA